MAYPTLSAGNAKKAYEALKECDTPVWAELESQRGSGSFHNYMYLTQEVDEVTKDFDFPLTDGEAGRLEGLVGVALHENIRDAEAIADPDFWRWISFRPLLDLTLSRHSTKKSSMPDPKNFGIGSNLENFAYRAWMRAEIGHDPSADTRKRYVLALRGDQDLWRSHLIRVRFAFHRPMAHALVEFQYPTDESDGVLKKGDKEDGIRVLAKRIARAQANTAFPMLDKEQCRCLILRLAEGLTTTSGDRFTASGLR